MRNGLARVFGRPRELEGLWSVEGGRRPDLADLVRVNLLQWRVSVQCSVFYTHSPPNPSSNVESARIGHLYHGEKRMDIVQTYTLEHRLRSGTSFRAGLCGYIVRTRKCQHISFTRNNNDPNEFPCLPLSRLFSSTCLIHRQNGRGRVQFPRSKTQHQTPTQNISSTGGQVSPFLLSGLGAMAVDWRRWLVIVVVVAVSPSREIFLSSV